MTRSFDPADPATDRRKSSRIDEIVEQAVQSAIEKARVIDPEIHEQHHEYLTIVLAREAKRAQRWEAIVDKSLAGLAWAAIAGLATALWTYAKEHILK